MVCYINNDMFNRYTEDIHNNIDNYRETLLDSLKNLMLVLEIYLNNFLIDNNVTIPFFDEIEFEKIINFNYTNTFYKIYGKKSNIETHYTHGEIRKNLDQNNNMVFGIEKELLVNDINKELEYADFQKYFQRIIKKTRNNYIHWLNDISECREPSNVIIYGHSLDVPNKEIFI